MLPTLDPDAAVAEIERLGGHPGFVQVLLPIRTEAPYGNPRYHRIWEAAERHGLVVGLHAWGRVGNAPTASGFTHSYLEDYASNSQIVVQAHVTSLVSEGVFERFGAPARRAARVRLRVAAVPAVALRQGLEGRLARGAVGQAAPVGVRARARPPHHRARAAAGRPRGLARLPDLMPVAELLMYASDHPHRHGGGIEPLLDLLDDDGRQAILAGNAAALYGL